MAFTVTWSFSTSNGTSWSTWNDPNGAFVCIPGGTQLYGVRRPGESLIAFAFRVVTSFYYWPGFRLRIPTRVDLVRFRLSKDYAARHTVTVEENGTVLGRFTIFYMLPFRAPYDVSSRNHEELIVRGEKIFPKKFFEMSRGP